MDCGESVKSLLAVANDGDAVTSFFEQARGQALIYRVIFRNEIREPWPGSAAPCTAKRVIRNQGCGAVLFRRVNKSEANAEALGSKQPRELWRIGLDCGEW